MISAFLLQRLSNWSPGCFSGYLDRGAPLHGVDSFGGSSPSKEYLYRYLFAGSEFVATNPPCKKITSHLLCRSPVLYFFVLVFCLVLISPPPSCLPGLLSVTPFSDS